MYKTISSFVKAAYEFDLTPQKTFVYQILSCICGEFDTWNILEILLPKHPFLTLPKRKFLEHLDEIKHVK